LKHKSTSEKLIFAAGGLIWRNNKGCRELLVVHRPKYNDWTLPKGKLKKSEGLKAAAIRESREESGYRVATQDFAGTLSYAIDIGLKVVTFWHMKTTGNSKFKPNKEIDKTKWIPVKQPEQYLTHKIESDFVKSASSMLLPALNKTKKKRNKSE